MKIRKKMDRAPTSMLLDGFRKSNPATVKKLPCTVDLPDLLCKLGLNVHAILGDRALGDLILIVFYVYCKWGNIRRNTHYRG